MEYKKAFVKYGECPISDYVNRESIGTKKMYKNNLDSISAVIIDRVKINLFDDDTDYIIGNRLAEGSEIEMRVAGKDGIEHVKVTRLPKLYNTPQDAAQKVGSNIKDNTASVERKENLSAAILEAFNKTSIWPKIMPLQSQVSLNFIYWEWNGTEAVKKYVNLCGHEALILDNTGWHFENEDFSEYDTSRMYTTRFECEEDNSIKVYDFPF